ncbi:MAG TPA: fumarylacetoacetate hydrolase family protein [Stellaceae bacterium]|jgi:fumarylacetoacetate (FAA) hydrolase family protein|nr:fumarylacetoacetate hydrolase family protein [Stellaceae bacterium]
MILQLQAKESLPEDGCAGTLIGRVWLPGAGPAVVVVHDDGMFDISRDAFTCAALLNEADPLAIIAAAPRDRRIGDVATILSNTPPDARDAAKPWFLAPIDLQAVKAAGVTFVRSLLERVVEEQARGDPARAVAVRDSLGAAIGGDLAAVKPGSQAAARLKSVLQQRGMWSQYLEVGIGPDVEIFTKCQPMASVGTGADIGIHPGSVWNNPEPEIVLAVNAAGRIVGATLGNDVNLRDFEGRSALLLGKAKDNNGSSAIGPFLRLFDATFALDDVRRAEVSLEVRGPEGYVLNGSSSLAMISRDPSDIVAQGIGGNHQYPDGFVLFLGTMFAPIEDRDHPGEGFTHKLGDIVTIASPKLGALVNRVGHSDRIAPWEFGTLALMRNLAGRGLL